MVATVASVTSLATLPFKPQLKMNQEILAKDMLGSCVLHIY